MREILLLAAMATLIPGFVLNLMMFRQRTALARSIPWYRRLHWCWWCWWVEKPKVETLLTPRGVTLFRISRPLLFIGLALYVVILWLY